MEEEQTKSILGRIGMANSIFVHPTLLDFIRQKRVDPRQGKWNKMAELVIAWRNERDGKIPDQLFIAELRKAADSGFFWEQIVQQRLKKVTEKERQIAADLRQTLLAFCRMKLTFAQVDLLQNMAFYSETPAVLLKNMWNFRIKFQLEIVGAENLTEDELELGKTIARTIHSFEKTLMARETATHRESRIGSGMDFDYDDGGREYDQNEVD